jgi:hypothetical protein
MLKHDLYVSKGWTSWPRHVVDAGDGFAIEVVGIAVDSTNIAVAEATERVA